MNKNNWKKTSFDTWQWKSWTIVSTGISYHIEGLGIYIKFNTLREAKEYCQKAETKNYINTLGIELMS